MYCTNFKKMGLISCNRNLHRHLNAGYVLFLCIGEIGHVHTNFKV